MGNIRLVSEARNDCGLTSVNGWLVLGKWFRIRYREAAVVAELIIKR